MRLHVVGLVHTETTTAFDWCAFNEIVLQGVAGFRCVRLAEFEDAAQRVGELDRNSIREYAIRNYPSEVVRHQSDHSFKRLATLKGKGWYELST